MRLLRDIAAGLARAHELGVIHRDLKPENVMVVAPEPGGRERVKIVDFGLSKMTDSDALLTGEGDVIGTPDFMAPEQWQGRAVDARADVYAFGILAYEVLSGALPYRGDTVIQLLQQHLYAEPTPLTAQKNVVRMPPGLAELVMRCMAKDPLDRPPHMGRVRDALAAVDDASRDLKIDSIRAGGAPVAATTVVSLDEGLLLDRRELHAEIARLNRVRRKRLTELVPKLLGEAPVPLVAGLQARIRIAEVVLEEAEEDLAIAEATLEEAQKAHRTREAELRAGLVAANLELAVARHALPGDVTDSYGGETLDLRASEGAADAPVDDADAQHVLRRAEDRLAAFVRAPDEVVERAERRVEEALTACRELETPLGVLYAELEATLAAIPGAGPAALAELSAIDGVVGAYRTRLEILERHAASEGAEPRRW